MRAKHSRRMDLTERERNTREGEGFSRCYFVKSQRGSGLRCINTEQKSCCNIPAEKSTFEAFRYI